MSSQVDLGLEDMTVEVDGSVATITFRRSKTYNSFHGELAKALRYCNTNSDVVFTVMTGEGKFFSSGQDLKDATSRPPAKDPHSAREESMRSLSTGPEAAAIALVDHKKILIAALNGPVIGWPAAAISVVDLIIASDNSYVYMPFMSLGISIEAGGSLGWRLRAGIGMANDMILTGRRATAQELLALGGIQRVFPSATFAKDAAGWVRELAKNNPWSQLEAKRIIREPLKAQFHAAIASEQESQIERAGISFGVPSGFSKRQAELASAKKSKM
ncbi:hypothetical protein HDU93_007229 [Gonapodya sp. JEL0774]|nr:hypothetical protein HDU93_007229 [Gonapodya sp. JEL0774]